MYVHNSYIKGTFFELNPPRHRLVEVGNTGVEVEYFELDGYWEHPDGSEGGDLIVEIDNGVMEVIDFDGDYDLPRLVKFDLLTHNIRCDF